MNKTNKTYNLTENQIQEKLDEILKNSYSPYSKARVACLLLFKNGETVCGCNVENSSYPCCICAESCAIVCAVASGKNLHDVEKVYIKSNQKTLFYPCGTCRQIMSEFLKDETEIIITTQQDKGLKDVQTLKNLLPFGFKF